MRVKQNSANQSMACSELIKCKEGDLSLQNDHVACTLFSVGRRSELTLRPGAPARPFSPDLPDSP